MDARFFRAIVAMAVVIVATSTQAGSYRTANFIVTAPTEGMAEQIGQAAERYRRDLAIEWLGKEMPAWSQPCPITAQVAPNLGAGGATSFLFERGEVFGWRMTIQGSLERILDSVLPHEVTHTVFATHFRRPLPRWADEGACTTVEHVSERNKQQVMLVDFLRTGRGIPFSKMFAMRDYPADVMPLYSQGYSLARYLIAQGGKQKFLGFVQDGLQDDNWQRAVHQNYGYADLGQLQNQWLDWVRQGSPGIEPTQRSLEEAPVTLASTSPAPAPRREGRQPAASAYPTDDDAHNLKPVPRRAARAEESYPPADRVAASPRARAASWQPRQRDFDLPEDDDRGYASGDEDGYQRDTAMPGPSAEPANYQVTRPQPPQPARQIILEWNRP